MFASGYQRRRESRSFWKKPLQLSGRPTSPMDLPDLFVYDGGARHGLALRANVSPFNSMTKCDPAGHRRVNVNQSNCGSYLEEVRT